MDDRTQSYTKKFIKDGTSLVERSLEFLFYLTKYTDDAPDNSTAKTYCSKLVDVLLAAPACKILMPEKGYVLARISPEELLRRHQEAESNPFLTDLRQLRIPSQAHNNPQLSDYFAQEYAGVYPPFQDDPESIRVYVAIHALTYELVKLILVCDEFRYLCEAGDVQLRGCSKGQIKVLMYAFDKLTLKLSNYQSQLLGQAEAHKKTTIDKTLPWIKNFSEFTEHQDQLQSKIKHCKSHAKEILNSLPLEDVSQDATEDTTIQFAQATMKLNSHITHLLQKLVDPSEKIVLSPRTSRAITPPAQRISAASPPLPRRSSAASPPLERKSAAAPQPLERKNTVTSPPTNKLLGPQAARPRTTSLYVSSTKAAIPGMVKMGSLPAPKAKIITKSADEVIDLCAIRNPNKEGDVRILNDNNVLSELQQEMAKKPHATDILLCNNNISGVGAAAVCKLLMKHPNLLKLDFSGNKIFNDADHLGAHQLVTLLKSADCKLEHLALNDCALCTENSISSNLLANAICVNKSLKVFDAQSNDINDDRFKSLRLALLVNSTLCELDFRSNKLTYETAIEFITVLGRKPQIIKLSLEENKISVDLLTQIKNKASSNANATAKKTTMAL